MQVLINSYIENFRILHEGDPWLDETFTKKLDGISEDLVFERPHGLLSAAEEIWHLLIWRRVNIRRLNGETVPFESVENWKSVSELRKMGWAALWKAFNDSLEELISWLEDKDDSFLTNTYPPTGYTYKYYMDGLVHHDAYHMGQIGLVLKLLKNS